MVEKFPWHEVTFSDGGPGQSMIAHIDELYDGARDDDVGLLSETAGPTTEELAQDPELARLYRPFDSQDRAWAVQLGCKWPAKADEAAWLEDVNELSVRASNRLPTHPDPLVSETEYENREAFLRLFPRAQSAYSIRAYRNDRAHHPQAKELIATMRQLQDCDAPVDSGWNIYEGFTEPDAYRTYVAAGSQSRFTAYLQHMRRDLDEVEAGRLLDKMRDGDPEVRRQALGTFVTAYAGAVFERRNPGDSTPVVHHEDHTATALYKLVLAVERLSMRHPNERPSPEDMWPFLLRHVKEIKLDSTFDEVQGAGASNAPECAAPRPASNIGKPSDVRMKPQTVAASTGGKVMDAETAHAMIAAIKAAAERDNIT